MPDLELPDKEFNQLSRNEKFLRKLRQIVESNLGNEQFGVECLAEAIDMSRIQVYRKLQRLTGKNISQYIREFRLKRAMELLKMDVANVAEIAYQVGFGSPAYFNKCFHDFYGYPPGEVVKKNQHERESPDAVITKEEEESKNILVRKKKKIIRDRYILNTFIILLGVVFIIVGVSYFIKVNRIAPQVKSATEKSIAVLPFRNDSPDPDKDYFFNSMQEEISKQLQKIQDLNVRPRQSVEQYRDTQKDIISIGEELNVAYILEGFGRFLGDSLRMWIKLTDARNNVQVWGEPCNVPFTTASVFDIQAKIAKKVAASLGAIITPDEEKRIDSRHVVPIEALRLNMRGRREISNFWDGLGHHHADSAMELYNQTLAIDPEFAFALASKGEVFFHRDRNFDSTIYYCKKAIKLDPEEGYGYRVLGNCYQAMEIFDLSIKNYLKTIELIPYAGGPYAQLGYLYITQKQDVVKGLPYLKRSIELQPLRELGHRIASESYFYIGDYEKAKEHAINTINYGDLHTCTGIYHYYTILIAQNKMREGVQILDSISSLVNCEDICNRGYWFLNLNLNDFKQAEKDYDKLIERGGFQLHDSIFLAYMYKQLGRNDDYQMTINYCRTRCEDLLDDNKENIYAIENLLNIYAILDEKEKALKCLSQFEKTGYHFNTFDFIEVSPVYENIRDNPEFKAIIRRVHEKKAAMKAQIRRMEADVKIKN